MVAQPRSPVIPLAGSMGSLRTLAGYVAGALFTAAVAFLCLKIMAFQPGPEADCFPEICGPASVS